MLNMKLPKFCKEKLKSFFKRLGRAMYLHRKKIAIFICFAAIIFYYFVDKRTREILVEPGIVPHVQILDREGISLYNDPDNQYGYFKYVKIDEISQNFLNSVVVIEDISAKDLDLAQSAFLAAIPNLPSYYDPYIHYDNTKYRQELILKVLLDQGKISKEQYGAGRN